MEIKSKTDLNKFFLETNMYNVNTMYKSKEKTYKT